MDCRLFYLDIGAKASPGCMQKNLAVLWTTLVFPVP